MKNIVFCADGTWNGTSVDDDDDGVPETTNVLKMYHLLGGDTTLASRRLQDEAEKQQVVDGVLVQTAKYIHGVGDSRNPVARLVGGAFGKGLIARIVRGYTFVSRSYDPGDRITILGFSRGAYTARALGGLISSVGLLNKQNLDLEGDKEMAYSMGVAAWREYREQARQQQPARSVREKLAELIASMPGYARVPLRDEDLRRDVEIHAIAVWDTVGALGIPLGSGNGESFDAYRFTDDRLSAKVRHGLHAVSLHERRQTFRPTLWKSRDGIRQVRFPGAHSDVGGGYPDQESGLSNIALRWMYDELAHRGLKVKDYPRAWEPEATIEHHEPWKQGIFKALGSEPRAWDGYEVADHESVAEHRCLRCQ